MNYKVKINGLTINAPELPAEFKLDSLEVEVENLDLKDSLQIARQLPHIILDLRRMMELPPEQVTRNPQTIDDAIMPGMIVALQCMDRSGRGVVDKVTRHHIYLEGVDEPFPKHEVIFFSVLEAADNDEA
jgi:hypothetical protein